MVIPRHPRRSNAELRPRPAAALKLWHLTGGDVRRSAQLRDDLVDGVAGELP